MKFDAVDECGVKHSDPASQAWACGLSTTVRVYTVRALSGPIQYPNRRRSCQSCLLRRQPLHVLLLLEECLHLRDMFPELARGNPVLEQLVDLCWRATRNFGQNKVSNDTRDSTRSSKAESVSVVSINIPSSEVYRRKPFAAHK